VDYFKIGAVVLEMALHAFAAVGIFHLQLRVIAPPGRQELGDFLMTFEAPERWLGSSKLMASGALRRAIEGLVRI